MKWGFLCACLFLLIPLVLPCFPFPTANMSDIQRQFDVSKAFGVHYFMTFVRPVLYCPVNELPIKDRVYKINSSILHL